MNELAVATRPDNLRVPYAPEHRMVTSDVFHICDRIKEIDPNLYVYVLDPPIPVGDHLYHYSIAERCADGVERLALRAEALDGRIIEQLQYLLRVPFEQRFREAERLEAKWNREQKEAELADLTEKIGLPMLPDLERTGFIQRSRSYAKRGVRPR